MAGAANNSHAMAAAKNLRCDILFKEWKYIEPNDGSKMIQWGPKIETGNDPNPQLYRISDNLYEQDNVAESNPQVVFEMQNILRRVR